MRRQTKISNRINRPLEDNKRSYLKQTSLEIKNELKHSHKRDGGEKEARAVKNINTNPKAFYRYAKESASVRYKTGPLFEENGSPTADPHTISEILNAQYKSSFTTPLGYLQVAMPNQFFGSTALHNEMAINYSIKTEETDVISAINEMR